MARKTQNRKFYCYCGKKKLFLLFAFAFIRRLQREAKELEKLNSGIGSAIAKDLKETAKYRKWKQQNLDPRNASRTPSASKEPVYKLRYEYFIFLLLYF